MFGLHRGFHARVVSIGQTKPIMQSRGAHFKIMQEYITSQNTSQQVAFPTHRWVIFTTVNPPTKQIQRLCALPGWSKLVVGDTKTNPAWRMDGCLFLSIEHQLDLGYQITELLPFKRYERKLVGYLFAIQAGAEVIYDTDDDNIPIYDEPVVLATKVCAAVVQSQDIAVNAYAHFGRPDLYNRGLPLNMALSSKFNIKKYADVNAFVQQGLVEIDPDLDALQRLLRTESETSNVHFEGAEALAFPIGNYQPINSQNTVFHKEAFWGLLLPITTLWREDDIFRGYWLQRLLWEINGSLLYTGSTAYQLRNPHDFMLDLAQEINMYKNTPKMLKFLNEWICSEGLSIEQCVLNVHIDLSKEGYIGNADVDIAKAWVSDLSSLGYVSPRRVQNQKYNHPINARLATEQSECDSPYILPQVIKKYRSDLQSLFDPVECGQGETRGCTGSINVYRATNTKTATDSSATDSSDHLVDRAMNSKKATDSSATDSSDHLVEAHPFDHYVDIESYKSQYGPHSIQTAKFLFVAEHAASMSDAIVQVTAAGANIDNIWCLPLGDYYLIVLKGICREPEEWMTAFKALFQSKMVKWGPGHPSWYVPPSERPAVIAKYGHHFDEFDIIYMGLPVSVSLYFLPRFEAKLWPRLTHRWDHYVPYGGQNDERDELLSFLKRHPTVFSSLRYDDMYYFHFTNRMPIPWTWNFPIDHFRSIVLPYVPQKRKFLYWGGANGVEYPSYNILLQGVLSEIRKRTGLSFGFEHFKTACKDGIYESLSEFRLYLGILFIPYSHSGANFAQLYDTGIPLIVPSKTFWVSEFAQGRGIDHHLPSNLVCKPNGFNVGYHQTFSNRDPHSCAPEDVKAWMDWSETEVTPHLFKFDDAVSAVDLMEHLAQNSKMLLKASKSMFSHSSSVLRKNTVTIRNKVAEQIELNKKNSAVSAEH